MAKMERGLYEVLITEALEVHLQGLGDRLQALRSNLRPAEAADRIALHLSRIIQRSLSAVGDEERVDVSIALARALLQQIDATIRGGDATAETPITSGSVLRAVATRQPDGSLEEILEPLIPLLDTTLLTNAPGEPRVGNQLSTEIQSADRIDVVMAFIRRSGIRPNGRAPPAPLRERPPPSGPDYDLYRLDREGCPGRNPQDRR